MENWTIWCMCVIMWGFYDLHGRRKETLFWGIGAMFFGTINLIVLLIK